jgi:protein ImuB
MKLSLAEALCHKPPLMIATTPQEEISLLYRLGRWALKFSPLVSIDEEVIECYQKQTPHLLDSHHYCLTINLTGTARLHDSEQALIARIDRALQARHLQARYALAPSAGAAWALAHYSPINPHILAGGADNVAIIREALLPLPINALRLSPSDLEGLRNLGIERINELLKLPFKKLSTRFLHAQSPHGVLSRIRQALGAEHAPSHLIRQKSAINATRSFEIPLMTHHAVATVILELLSELFEKLTFERKSTRCLIVELKAGTAQRMPVTFRKEITLCHATRDLTHARSVIEPIVESLSGIEGVVFISILARLTTRTLTPQESLPTISGGSMPRDDQPASQLLNLLRTRCGNSRVVIATRHHSYLPERSFSYVPVGTSRSKSEDIGAVPCLRRPSYLFDTPQPITAIALLPDLPPSLITWGNTRLPVIEAEGPERICIEWWRSSADNSLTPSPEISTYSRDYFSLKDPHGRWLWTYRDNRSGEWFLHGMWV